MTPDPLGHRPHAQTPAEWDARYAEAQMWSGDPNGLLVREVADLAPGRALDVGCGEGADAIWLAGRGWRVTAVDVSRRAIDRGRAAAEAAHVEVDWVVADVVEAAPGWNRFDLVSAFYPVFRKAAGELETVLDLVAPGGTLLFVHHLEIDRDRAREHGFDPDDYVQVADVPGLLTDGWTVEKSEQVKRDVRAGAGAHHKLDGLVRAVREG